MPAPDSTIEEIRSSVLRYLRRYEEGHMTLSDLAADLAVLAPAYDHAMGGLDDSYQHLLAVAYKYQVESRTDGGLSQHEWEQALTEFRRAEAAW